MQLRAATSVDLGAIFAIYNAEVRDGTATFDTEPVDSDGQARWLTAHEGPTRPAIVAVEGEALLGWAAASDWSSRCAYARAAEVSVYVDPAHQRRGAGRALLTELIARCRAAGVGVLLARITSESGPSLGLHEKLGFTRIGTMRRVGEKFGRVLDVELLELHLDAG